MQDAFFQFALYSTLSTYNSIIIQSDNKVQFLSTFRLFCDSTLPFSIGFFVACLMYATRVVQGNYRLSGYPVGQLCLFLPLMHET